MGKFSICFLLHHACFLTKLKAFLSMERKTLLNAFFFIIKQQRKFYYFCYLRHNSALTTANNCTNVLPKCFKKSWKAKKIHTKVIHPLSSPQFPSYHEKSSDPFKRFAWNNNQDKEMRDLLTSSVTMTDLKISQAEAHWSCCPTKSYRK